MTFDVNEACWTLQKPRTRADIFIDKFHARGEYIRELGQNKKGRNSVMALRSDIERKHNVSLFKTLPKVNVKERVRELKSSIFGVDDQDKNDFTDAK